MRSPTRSVMIFAVAAVLFPVPARATTITFDVNCQLGPSGCTNTTSVGTVTLTDNGDVVDVSFSMDGYIVHSVYLNYDESKFSSADDFGTNVGNDTNNYKADGWSGGFDLKSPPADNANSNPYTFTLAVAGKNLSVYDFLFKDSDGVFYVALHTVSQGDWFGSVAYVDDPGDPNVPEPAGLLLVGTALAAGALQRRFRRTGR